MMLSASVVLPEPEPPSTAAWRFSTSLLSVMLLLGPLRAAGQDAASAPSAGLIEQNGRAAAPCSSGCTAGLPCRSASCVALRHERRLSGACVGGWRPSRPAPPCRARRRARRTGRAAAAAPAPGSSDSSLARWNQSAKPGSWRCCAWNSRTIIMRSHSGIGTSSERPPLSRNLRKACAVWFFLLGGKSLARSMKQFLPSMAGSTRSSWRLRPPPCVGRLHRKMRASCGEARLVPQREVDGGQVVGELEALDGELDGAAPLLARRGPARRPARRAVPGRRTGSPPPTAP